MERFQKQYPGAHFDIRSVSTRHEVPLFNWVLILLDGKVMVKGHDYIRCYESPMHSARLAIWKRGQADDRQRDHDQRVSGDLKNSPDRTEMTRYRTGMDTYLNVITAETTLLSNWQSLVSLQTSQMTSAVQLITALGGGWDTSSLPTERQVAQKR